MELVGTTLCYSVDCATRKTGMTDIERSDIYAHLLESIQGNRASSCREVGADTKSIVESGTVNGNVRGTVVATADSKSV